MSPSGLTRLVILSSLLAACAAPGVAQTAPTADTLKQVLTRKLLSLRPDGVTERNVLYQDVVAGRPTGGTYPFRATLVIRDYGPGYPANRYYGETCVARITGWTYQLSVDDLGAWQVEGRMTPDLSQRTCQPNPSAGVSSQPLTGLSGVAAPEAPAPVAARRAPAAAAGAGVAAGAYECWANGEARMLLNFTVSGAGQYVGADRMPGRFRLDARTSRMTFAGGALDGAMPDGFYAVYHVVQGRPTVSFMSPRGSEAMFCQKR